MHYLIGLCQNLCPFIFVLLTIVFVHEFGHYFVAKLCKVKVEVFSIGFGKEIYGWNDKSGTRWKICWIPIGGYVKMLDDKLSEVFVTVKESGSFNGKSLWQKSAIVIAGPAMNFLFAILIIAVLLFSLGKYTSPPKIDFIQKGSVAEKTGLQVGDLILSVDGSEVSSFNELVQLVSMRYDQKLTMKIERDSLVIDKSLTPELVESKDTLGNITKIGRIGIQSNNVMKIKYSLSQAVVEGIRETYNITAATFLALKQIVTSGRGTEGLSGPIGIAKYSSQAASGGIVTLLMFMAILSINLGLMNLLPIPVLDGGHLLFYLIETVMGKKIAASCQHIGITIGIVFLLSTTIFTTVNDLKKIIF